GSLVERGGHNPLEPAALGLPTLMGPHVFNFQDICNQLSAAEGLIYVGAGENLGARLVELAEDDLLRERIGAAGLAVVKRNQGALGRLLELMRRLSGNKCGPWKEGPGQSLSPGLFCGAVFCDAGRWPCCFNLRCGRASGSAASGLPGSGCQRPVSSAGC